MNEQLKNKMLLQAIELLSKANALLVTIQNDLPRSKRTMNHIEKYVSNAGNITWRLYEKDTLTVVYIRQSMKDEIEHGIWTQLESMEMNVQYACDIEIETIQDGDFHKLVYMDKWVIFPLDEDDYMEQIPFE